MAMYRDNCRMPEKYWIILQDKYTYIIENVLPDELADHLYSRFVIKQSAFEEITAEKQNKGNIAAMRKILDALKFSGAEGYPKFLVALKKLGYHDVVKELEKAEVDGTNIPGLERAEEANEFQWIDSLPDITKNHVLTEKDLNTIAQCLGAGWESIASHLGCRQAQISQMTMNYPHTIHMQIFSTLNKWRQRVASGARLIVLLEAFRESSLAIIDWDKIQKIAENQR